jgi:acetoin utilization protein AcuC
MNRRTFLSGLTGAGVVAGLASAAPDASSQTCLFAGPALARYGFGDGHPLGMDRQGAFLEECLARGLNDRVRLVNVAPPATVEERLRFHSPSLVERVRTAEAVGLEFLDDGDTPVFHGVHEAASAVVGAALDGMRRILRGECLRTFQPIGGLHHAARGHAAGFCVYSDLGVVIESLREEFGIRRVAYIDIDVHHGDGIFYAYESDPDLIFADIHEDGRSLYPGTGRADETGRGAAAATKLNLPLVSGSDDTAFLAAWPVVEEHLARFPPDFLLFQCGADGLAGDPLAHLRYSPAVHLHAARRVRWLAERYCGGRMMAFGGGGYDRRNLAQAWSNVLAGLLGD